MASFDPCGPVSTAIFSDLARVVLLTALFCQLWVVASFHIGSRTSQNSSQSANLVAANLGFAHRFRWRLLPCSASSFGPRYWSWLQSCGYLWLSSPLRNLSDRVRYQLAYCFFYYSSNIRS
jgi:hypothetical protein